MNSGNKAFHAHGLVLTSDWDLSPLPRVEGLAADVVIQRGLVSEDGLPDARLSRAFLQVNSDNVWIDIPHIARFLVTGGDTVLVEPYADARDEDIVLYLMGSVMAAVLNLRKHLALHATAMEIDGRAILVAGHSGAGKSTTAAALAANGHCLIAEDLTVIDEAGRAVPGLPQIKLWSDAIKKLQIGEEDLSRIRMQVSKFRVPVPATSTGPVLVSAVFLLGTQRDEHNGELRIEKLEGLSRFNQVRRHTFRRTMVEGMGRGRELFTRYTQMLDQMPIYRIVRPVNRFTANEIAKLIEQALEETAVEKQSG